MAFLSIRLGVFQVIVFYFMENSTYFISVIGLGYVGLPLAVEFSKYYPVVGFDINKRRVEELQKGMDGTLEVEEALLKEVSLKTAPDMSGKGLYCSGDMRDINDCNVYVITL